MELDRKITQFIFLILIIAAVVIGLSKYNGRELEADRSGIELTGRIDSSGITFVQSDKRISFNVPVSIRNPLDTELELLRIKYAVRLGDDVVYSGELSDVYNIPSKSDQTVEVDFELGENDFKRYVSPSVLLNMIGRGSTSGMNLAIDFSSLITTTEGKIDVISMLSNEDLERYEEEAMLYFIRSIREKLDAKIPEERRDALDTIALRLLEGPGVGGAEAYYSLGLVAIFEKDIDVATWAFSKASEEQHESLPYLASLTWALNEQGMNDVGSFDDSMLILSTIKSSGISLAPIYNNLGFAANGLRSGLLDKGMRTSELGLHVSELHDITVDSYKHAVAMNESHPGYHMGLGKAYLAVGDTDIASEEFSKAYILDPTDSVGPAYIFLMPSVSIECRQIDCQCELYDTPSLFGGFEPETCKLEESNIRSSCDFGEYNTCPTPKGSYSLIKEPFSWSTPANFKVTLNPDGRVTTELVDLVTKESYTLAFRPSWKENARFKGYGLKSEIGQFRQEPDIPGGHIDFSSAEEGWTIKPVGGFDPAGWKYLLPENWIDLES
ncbi:MAG: LEA type 2 family protein [Candidatus Hydrothermarchaeales archaeon]